MPALLKPAPAELITLLWALKNDGLDKPGYGDLIPALAAGRTSVVTDPTFERMFYKLRRFPLPRQARRAHRHPGAPGRSHPSAAAVEAGRDAASGRRL